MNHLLMIGLAALGLSMLGGCAAVRGGYESAPYRVVRVVDGLELRDYPRLEVAETRMGDGANGGFGRLFRYITGNNAQERHIPMTTPVLMQGGRMGFVMPSTSAATSLPKPSDPSVSLASIPGGRFAVLRFSGGRSRDNEAAAERRLRERMVAAGLQAESEPIFGYFDPPWTPSFLRRNEVMVRIAAPHS